MVLYLKFTVPNAVRILTFTGPFIGGAVRRSHARVNGGVTFFYAIGIELFNFSGHHQVCDAR